MECKGNSLQVVSAGFHLAVSTVRHQKQQCCIVLYCTVLCCAVLLLYSTLLYCTVLHCTVLHYSVLCTPEPTTSSQRNQWAINCNQSSPMQLQCTCSIRRRGTCLFLSFFGEKIRESDLGMSLGGWRTWEYWEVVRGCDAPKPILPQTPQNTPRPPILPVLNSVTPLISDVGVPATVRLRAVAHPAGGHRPN